MGWGYWGGHCGALEEGTWGHGGGIPGRRHKEDVRGVIGELGGRDRGLRGAEGALGRD